MINKWKSEKATTKREECQRCCRNENKLTKAFHLALERIKKLMRVLEDAKGLLSLPPKHKQCGGGMTKAATLMEETYTLGRTRWDASMLQRISVKRWHCANLNCFMAGSVMVAEEEEEEGWEEEKGWGRRDGNEKRETEGRERNEGFLKEATDERRERSRKRKKDWRKRKDRRTETRKERRKVGKGGRGGRGGAMKLGQKKFRERRVLLNPSQLHSSGSLWLSLPSLVFHGLVCCVLLTPILGSSQYMFWNQFQLAWSVSQL